MTRPLSETSGWFRHKKQIKLVAEGWNELQKMSRNIRSLSLFSRCDSRRNPFWCEWFWGTLPPDLVPSSSTPFPRAVCIIFFSLSTIVSGSLQAQRKEEGSLPRRQPRRKAKFRAGWERCIAKVIAKTREREIEPPIHKNINSFAAAIRDKIYYQPAGRWPGRMKAVGENERLLLSLSLAESNIAGLYWSMPG